MFIQSPSGSLFYWLRHWTVIFCISATATPITNFEVDQSVFEIPKSYHVQDNGRDVHLQDEDYEVMQFAIQQSLVESSRSQVRLLE